MTEEDTKHKKPQDRIYKTERHIRWNWQRSPDTSGLVRYHFIVVDDKNREGIMGKILEQLSIGPFFSPIEPIRSMRGDVGGSRLKYLFQSYDSNTPPRLLDFSKIRKPVKRDMELSERVRKRHSIEKYVERIYSG